MAHKEKTFQEDINESFNKTNQVIFETQAHCCDITKSLIDKEQEPMENEKQTTKQYFDMINCLIAPSGKKAVICIQDNNYEDYVEIRLNNYEIKEENGKYYAIKKKPKYPKTYEECCEILNYESDRQTVTGYNSELIENFQKLLICRDAYWKIAGDWKYNVNNTEEYFYIVNKCGHIMKEHYMNFNHIIAFPTKEIRDTFYINFKNLIEAVKELL